MYTIYKGLKSNGEWKIGCDENYPARPKKQNLTDYFILEEHEDIEVASDLEIELQIEHGVPVDTQRYSDISRSNKSLEKRRKISATMSGENHPMYGRNHSTKTRQKMSAARSGEKLSAETRRKIRAARSGKPAPNRKLTFEQAEEIRSRYQTEKTSTNKLGFEYGVSGSTIWRIIRNEMYTTP